MRHRHADLIHAWADGAEIEYFSPDDNWHLVDSSVEDWRRNNYRIKPTSKPDWVTTLFIDPWMNRHLSLDANLRLIFDGETGKLKSAEVLN